MRAMHQQLLLGMYGMCYECAPTSERIFWIVFMAFILIFGILLLRWISIGLSLNLNKYANNYMILDKLEDLTMPVYFSNANDKNHHLRY